MDNEKKPEQLNEDSWLDDLLGPQDTGDQILADEQAAMDAGLTDPNDLELEKLLAEFGSEAAETPEVPAEAEPEVISANPTEADAPFRDQEFRDTFGEGESLEAAFADPGEDSPEPAPQEEVPEEEAPRKKLRWWKKEVPQKRRPVHKKGYGFFGIPHILATCIWLGLAVIIGATAGNVLWMLGADVLAFNQEPKTVTIVITEEDTLESVAQQLQEKELIRYPWLFELFAELTGKDQEISPGSYTLNKPDENGNTPKVAYDYNALLNSMQQYAPVREIVTIYFPEGFTCRDVFEKLAENGVCTVEELEEYAANGELDEYWFLEGVERGDKYCLEGYLFPDTYDFYKDDEPGRVIDKLLAAFDDRFTEKMHEDLIQINETVAQMMRDNGYSESYIEEHPIGIREVVIIASMIEKESPGADESYTISSVMYNRLSDPDFSLLQIDATVNYAHMLVYGNDDELDYTLDEPHNTYVYSGLPIGPISNPGRSSLDAALNPEETQYYYYALYRDSREHAFFRYLDDFEDFLWEQGYYDD